MFHCEHQPWIDGSLGKKLFSQKKLDLDSRALIFSWGLCVFRGSLWICQHKSDSDRPMTFCLYTWIQASDRVMTPQLWRTGQLGSLAMMLSSKTSTFTVVVQNSLDYHRKDVYIFTYIYMTHNKSYENWSLFPLFTVYPDFFHGGPKSQKAYIFFAENQVTGSPMDVLIKSLVASYCE